MFFGFVWFFFNLGPVAEMGACLKPGFLFFVEEGEESNWDLKMSRKLIWGEERKLFIEQERWH